MYLYQQFNVAVYFQNPVNMTKNTMNRIMNSVATGLNDRVRLPKYVIVVMDIDILNSIDFYDYAMPKVFCHCIQWIIKNVNRLFTIRSKDLKRKRPGSVNSDRDTRIIWENILSRPTIKDHPDQNRTKMCAGRPKFNELLNQVISDTRFNHALNIRGVTEQNHFTQLGDISTSRQYVYWKELDYIIKKFDRHEINLKPSQQDCGDYSHQPC